MRTARLNLDKGEHTVVFNDLPAEAVPGSIRVDGKATGKLDIGSVDTRRRYVARADQAALQAERKQHRGRDRAAARRARRLAQGQEDAAQTQKTLLANLAALPRPHRAARRASRCRRGLDRRFWVSSRPAWPTAQRAAARR